METLPAVGAALKELYVFKARGGVKVDFPVFTYLIRAAGDEQEEKTGPKSDLAFLRYRAPNIEVYM